MSDITKKQKKDFFIWCLVKSFFTFSVYDLIASIYQSDFVSFAWNHVYLFSIHAAKMTRLLFWTFESNCQNRGAQYYLVVVVSKAGKETKVVSSGFFQGEGFKNIPTLYTNYTWSWIWYSFLTQHTEFFSGRKFEKRKRDLVFLHQDHIYHIARWHLTRI